ncbi:multidrug efflux pump subunit AcrB [Sporomusaceae bacterium BoRhaA]|uniref:efflux RND transporter permease subunit n=1 Tax=Pelorhabdus rhamnosifermentans TaxID=2772457 RepID=UPI001C0613D5|nr:efflux RND transporter permease subunit [Pelorhabdus rhamnosifermentans]MBU2702753.1 multidrug efflux pump subunit AcrB [Pelorhabdus rhamnosifermentans]
MKKFNLTEYCLGHQQVVFFFVLLFFIAGTFSYFQLGRSEDPEFTVRQMIVQVAWPGATAKQVEEQVTDKIEKKLQETPGLDYINSYSRPGAAVIFVNLSEDMRIQDIRPTWQRVRNLVQDTWSTMPEGVIGPSFNDTYGDTFGSIYAVTADGFSFAEMKTEVDRIRLKLLEVPDVGKVELEGNQPEKIYIEFENNKLAALGIDPQQIVDTLSKQNAMNAAGRVETTSDNVYMRVTGIFQNVEDIKNIAIRANNRLFRLGDIAEVKRDYADPPEPKMYYNGQPAIGLAVSMQDGGNILNLGDHLNQTIERITQELPLGMEIHAVSDQPKVVRSSINEFVETLLLAIIIVLGVNFLSLGKRAGFVVALSIPLVICISFLAMKLFNINLHKVSLGALIIALGLLVDDAIISIEMMELKLEEGWTKFRAATYAYTVTSKPMLTGTLITAAGFLPVAISTGKAAEYTGTLFSVVTIALLASWVVSVTVIPLFGYHILKIKPLTESDSSKNLQENSEGKFKQIFRKVLYHCLHHNKLVIVATLAAFIVSLGIGRLVTQEFFPTSLRPELIVELTLPEGSSFQATDQEAAKLAELLKQDPAVVNFASYVGKGSPRFVLTMDMQLNADNFAQLIVLTKNDQERDRLAERINGTISSEFPEARIRTSVLSNGPPAAYPVMFRVSGENPEVVRSFAEQVRGIVAQYPAVTETNLDWYEKSKVLHLDIDQDKARALGIDSQTLATSLQTNLSGLPVTQYQEKDNLINIVLRTVGQDRQDLSRLKDLNIPTTNGRYVPLEQIAKLSYEGENGLIWRRGLEPTITVQADVAKGILGNDVVKDIDVQLKDLRQELPFGYTITPGGSAEDSTKSIGSLAKTLPIMVAAIVILLMLQLQHMGKMALVLLTAPLGMIGVNLFLFIFHRPMGFVAELGVLALAGMIMRNSVILLDQIDQHLAQGEKPWDAIIDSTILRFRPIMLTALAAILGMVPLAVSPFWGPMAISIMGGLFIATVLTLLYLPALYAACFRIHPDTESRIKLPRFKQDD